MPLIDHIEFAVTDAEASRRFYEQALAPLGVTLVISRDANGRTRHGFGRDGYPSLWIHDQGTPGDGHVAIQADSREAVNAFHQAALAAGGRDNGPPGIRSHYQANYYAAFVLDPDGFNVEALYLGA
ncbi:VOC family protein [Luteibacter sahnii]|uniref:VOC family protein n=1 Tax=Luteibacter sahnii TaxID=3021977 RepID=UPI002A6A05F1|nr:VOC family protein [Luteibacter sp. PPL193]MDY1548727.1 VOC family protein [Luteibacter sp. PPL193]